MKKYGKLVGIFLVLTVLFGFHAKAGWPDLGGLLDGLGSLAGSLEETGGAGGLSGLGSLLDSRSSGGLGSLLDSGSSGGLGSLLNPGSLANAGGTGGYGEGGTDASSLIGLLLGGGSSESAQNGTAVDAGPSSAAGAGLDLLMNLLGASGRSMKDCTVTKISDQVYTGDPIRPLPVVRYKGDRLKKGTDYTVTYSSNTKVGTAKVTLKGKGSYTGTKTVFFKIVRKNAASAGSTGKKATSGTGSADKGGSSGSGRSKNSGRGKSGGSAGTGKGSAGSSAATGKGSSKGGTGKGSEGKQQKRFTVKTPESSYVYNGKARKPDVSVTSRGKKVAKSDYTVTYKNNRSVGKASVSVKGKGAYRGYAGETTFRITLKKTALTGASSKGTGTVTCRWNPDSQADGYQLGYAPDKLFKKEKTLRVAGGTRKLAELTKLTSGKQYYVRIRSYRKVGSSNWYSEWSAAKTVKVK